MKTRSRSGSRRWRPVSWMAVVAALALAATGARPATAAAPESDDGKTHPAGDWSLGVDLGFGSVITAYAIDAVDSGATLLTGLRLGYGLSDDWTAQVVLDQRWLPNDNHATTPALGLRWRLFEMSWGLPYVEAAAG